jgi:catechol 2,3-dioxygenase-like lactoylglutathione lyase family enzyme
VTDFPARAEEAESHAAKEREAIMQIKLASILVNDQENALRFYTTILGFVKKTDLPVGEFRWLTVSSPEGVEGAELVLEPIGFPPARTYQKALFDAGIPATAFITSDIQAEFQRLKDLGVRFRGEPQSMGPVTVVAFEDTCGNLIQLAQPAA